MTVIGGHVQACGVIRVLGEPGRGMHPGRSIGHQQPFGGSCFTGSIYQQRMQDTELEARERLESPLLDLVKTAMTSALCWQIDINMTLIYLPKNCSPIRGKIIFIKQLAVISLSSRIRTQNKLNEKDTCLFNHAYTKSRWRRSL